jgi:aminopeptidase N
VAGDLACLEDSFVTRSGRKVALRIYAEQEAIGQCGHAMDSLKRSMQWDEDVYGLEYDLDLFQIVGVADFNFGAMENKGLYIFNTSAMLARSDTSTVVDFQHVERVIAHEYFHNWTGDRVTCRDWFQLTLKEGLTVFRDQQFSADMHSAAVKRIAEVALLREGQFAEDAGPLAHPIRPDSYVEINNFYTRTVYDKGAEVIRMIHTLIGAEAFRKGMDLYIERHDGKAVTCEDFLAAMADASGRDFSAFKRWYGQAGTPEIKVERHYDPERQTFTLELSQSTPPTPGQPTKRPLHIPVSMGLVGRGGGELPLQLEGENEPRGKARLLELTDERQSFVFVNVEAEPVPSLLRGFSAPVRLDAGYSPEELGVLMKHDSDPFARWEAAQTLATGLALDQVRRFPERGEVALDDTLVEAFAALLDGPMDDPAFLARALSLPGRSFVAQQLETISVEALHATFKTFQQELGTRLRDRWRRVYLAQREADNTIIDTPSMGRRALGNVCLAYLVWSGGEEEAALAQTRYRNAATMTNRLAALRLLAESGRPEREALLADFYAAWKDEPLVVNKWFALQAAVEEEGTVERVKELTRHPAFTMGNPNRVRALFGIFAAGNMLAFHRPDGQGYALVADRVLELDGANPQVAARLLTAFGRWRRFDAARQRLMQAELKRILAAPGLSRDCHEIASKSLG